MPGPRTGSGPAAGAMDDGMTQPAAETMDDAMTQPGLLSARRPAMEVTEHRRSPSSGCR